MAKVSHKSSGAPDLRKRAEERLDKGQARSGSLAAMDRERLIHEMQVHHVELDMQNEELKRMRNEAEALAAKYRDIFDFAPLGYLVLNSEGTILEANLTSSHLLALPRSLLIGRGLANFVTPRSHSACKAFLQRVFVTETETETETQTETCEFFRQGKPPFLAQIEARVTANGRECRLALIDVTERRKAEEGLRRYELLAAHGRDAILFADSNGGRILEANAAAMKDYGYTREEFCVMTLPDLCATGAMAGAISQTAGMMAGEGLLFESLHRRKDGTTFPVEISLGSVAAEGGRTMVAVIRNITARKAAEKTLQEKTEQIESANRELESFSYSVSHDLQTPLRAIDGYARMILRKAGGQLDDETRSRFEVIRANILKMGRLIDDLLAFSRLGRRRLSVDTVDMEAVVTEVWEELKTINPARSMTLRVSGIPPGTGDRALLRQVVANLLANAVKFTGTRGEAVIEAYGYVKDGENVYVIRDNGVGFDMAYYDKLFGMFQRLHSPDEYEGTGIGLAIAQRIVNRHGGRIWAEGQVDKGATFYFSLPIP